MRDDNPVEYFLNIGKLPLVTVGLEVGLFIEIMEAEYDNQIIDKLYVDAVLNVYLGSLDVQVELLLEGLDERLAEQQKQLQEAVVERHNKVNGLAGTVGVGLAAVDNGEVLLGAPGLVELLLAASPFGLVIVVQVLHLVADVLQRVPEFFVVDQLVELVLGDGQHALGVRRERQDLVQVAREDVAPFGQQELAF